MRLLRTGLLATLFVGSAALSFWWFALRPGPAAPPDPGEEPLVCFGQVDIEGGVIALSSSQAGEVVAVSVKEDQEVKQGQELLRLNDQLARSRRDEAQALVDAAGARLAQLKQMARTHEAQLARQQAAVEVARAALDGAQRLLLRKQELVRSRLLDASEADLQADQVRQQEAALRAEQARLREVSLLDSKPGIRAAEADLGAARARLEQANWAVEHCVLRAPQPGRVLRLQVNAGDWLTPGARPALLFSPRAPLVVRAEVAQEYAHLIRVGQQALVRLEPGEGPERRVRVQRIAPWIAPRRSVLLEPGEVLNSRTLECVLELPAESPFRIGQRVRVYFPPEELRR